jgi:hypothetical protein
MHPRPQPGDFYFLNLHGVKGYANIRYSQAQLVGTPQPLNELTTQFAAQLCRRTNAVSSGAARTQCDNLCVRTRCRDERKQKNDYQALDHLQQCLIE